MLFTRVHWQLLNCKGCFFTRAHWIPFCDVLNRCFLSQNALSERASFVSSQRKNYSSGYKKQRTIFRSAVRQDVESVYLPCLAGSRNALCVAGSISYVKRNYPTVSLLPEIHQNTKYEVAQICKFAFFGDRKQDRTQAVNINSFHSFASRELHTRMQLAATIICCLLSLRDLLQI